MLINKKLRLTFMQIAINSVLLGDKLFALIFVRIDFMLGCECHYWALCFSIFTAV